MQIYEKLIALLTLLMEESWHPDIARAPGSKKQNLQEIKDYLDTHYTEKITLDALAERFYINKFYLTRVFKEQFGQSVTNYLVQLRITQSKRLLRFTDRSIEAVAQECGLNDANYFSRLFKKVEAAFPFCRESRRAGFCMVFIADQESSMRSLAKPPSLTCSKRWSRSLTCRLAFSSPRTS